MSKLEDLRGKIERREARIGVIGLGYVGLPLVTELGRAGFPVVGFDVDQEKVRAISEGREPTEIYAFPDLDEPVRMFFLEDPDGLRVEMIGDA